MRRWPATALFALAAVAAAAMTPASAQIKNRACPGDTLLFGYGDQYGCVRPGSNEKVISCFRQKTCPSGWTGAGIVDDRGHDICCPPLPKPKQESLEEMLDRVYPNRTCFWDGTAPFCEGKCPSDYPAKYPSKDGRGMPSGFGKKCITGMKVYCCKFGPH